MHMHNREMNTHAHKRKRKNRNTLKKDAFETQKEKDKKNGSNVVALLISLCERFVRLAGESASETIVEALV